MITTALIVFAALGLDWLWGEPRRWHPLVGFGALADRVEHRLNHPGKDGPVSGRARGLAALVLLLLPATTLTASLMLLPEPAAISVSVLVLYLALGHKSLHDHVRPIATALLDGDEDRARTLAGRIVSRDREALDIAKSACESALENGNDSIFAALFWFLVAGAPGVVFFRLANTLDAMWGYRSARFEHFGWAAARLDDALNYLPARLTALTYALLAPLVGGRTKTALSCWRTQAPRHDSPNAGPVMASGAGALGISLGGPARYGGKWHERPILGAGPAPKARDILRALRLIGLGVLLWLGALLSLSLLMGGLNHA